MKKFVLLFIGVIAMPSLFAQDITDAIRYSTDEVKGTARFRAMSGAFGALGGDMSAVSINPAGSAIFNNSHASVTLSNFNPENTVGYFGNTNLSSNSSFDLSQGGGAFVFRNTNSNSPWRKFVLGLAYEQTSNFDNDFFASGTNTNSIDSYFLANAQGKRLDQISRFEGESDSEAYGDIGATFGYPHQQAFLGFESFILEPEDINDDANTVYFSNIAPGTFNQEYSYVANGYNGKFTVNAAFQHENNLYLGLNLNSHFINYNRSTYLFEGNSNPGSLITEVGFENNLSVIGNGFSFQLGGIAKLSDILRLGLTYDSPTWYTISEETTQYLATVRDDNGGNITKTLNPQIINIFPDYKLQTPAKVTGSAAIILSKMGLISFDYSRKDYSKMKFKPESDSHFIDQNNIISSNLKVANTYRIGGELRHDQFSFRAGFKKEESPYEDEQFYGDLTGYSLGVGYSFGNAKLDLAYENSEREVDYQLFNVGLTDAARINTKNSDVTLSLSFKL
ncbi:MAG: transporter [Flavobacteriaceae bacterium]|nr:transporter [Flavobacteriaceae bacterium]